jgi:hypothetical protein
VKWSSGAAQVRSWDDGGKRRVHGMPMGPQRRVQEFRTPEVRLERHVDEPGSGNARAPSAGRCVQALFYSIYPVSKLHNSQK